MSYVTTLMYVSVIDPAGPAAPLAASTTAACNPDARETQLINILDVPTPEIEKKRSAQPQKQHEEATKVTGSFVML